MRSLIFYAIIAYLFYGGITNYNRWQESATPLETPVVGADLANISFGLLPSFGESKASIAPNNQWEEILIGKWKCKTVYQSIDYIRLFEGEVTYSADSTYVKRISYKAVNKESGNVFIKAGGTIKGRWRVNNDSTWHDMPLQCDIAIGLNNSNSKELDICDNWFKNYDFYGYMEHNTRDFEIVNFNNSKIEIKEKDLGDELEDVHIFTRISD